MATTPVWYRTHLAVHGDPTPDWRWRRAVILASGHTDRYRDDEETIRATTLIRDGPGTADDGPEDLRAAYRVYAAGGPVQERLEALLLTDLSVPEVATSMWFPAAMVTAYLVTYYDVRPSDRQIPFLGTRVWEAARSGASRLVKQFAVRFGPIGVDLAEGLAAGRPLPIELAERLERERVWYELWATNVPAARRAVERLRALDAGLSPGVMHQPRRRGVRRPVPPDPVGG